MFNFCSELVDFRGGPGPHLKSKLPFCREKYMNHTESEQTNCTAYPSLSLSFPPSVPSGAATFRHFRMLFDSNDFLMTTMQHFHDGYKFSFVYEVRALPRRTLQNTTP